MMPKGVLQYDRVSRAARNEPFSAHYKLLDNPPGMNPEVQWQVGVHLRTLAHMLLSDTPVLVIFVVVV